MNDKRDMSLSVLNMIEWCGRYGNFTQDMEITNWELYLGDRIIAYNYDEVDNYIVKYSATGYFPKEYKLDVSYDHLKQSYNLTKKYV